jgi:putative methyltransferase (TIGR04325 family)
MFEDGKNLMAVPNIRSLIVDLSPPIFLRLAQRLRHRMRYFKRGMGFSLSVPSCYPSVEDAECGDAYNDDEYARLIVANKLQAMKSETYENRSGHLILPLIVSQFFDKPLTILDFGGGAAAGLFSILDQTIDLDLTKISYVLVETPAMCRAVRDKLLPVVPPLSLKIVEDIPPSLAAPLIVNLGSSIQYMPRYQEILARLASLSPQFIIVSRTKMTDAPTCVQHELHPYKKVVSWIFNRSEFIAHMRSLRYACIFKIDHRASRTNTDGPQYGTKTSMVFRRLPSQGLASADPAADVIQIRHQTQRR